MYLHRCCTHDAAKAAQHARTCEEARPGVAQKQDCDHGRALLQAQGMAGGSVPLEGYQGDMWSAQRLLTLPAPHQR